VVVCRLVRMLADFNLFVFVPQCAAVCVPRSVSSSRGSSYWSTGTLYAGAVGYSSLINTILTTVRSLPVQGLPVRYEMMHDDCLAYRIRAVTVGTDGKLYSSRVRRIEVGRR
jgi:hypothetical protein